MKEYLLFLELCYQMYQSLNGLTKFKDHYIFLNTPVILPCICLSAVLLVFSHALQVLRFCGRKS